MDVLYFLKDRTRFIRQHYETAAEPFREIKRKIEAEETPYIPEYSEDGEPPFLEEWVQADTSLEVVGRACLSMLSASLKLYLNTWERELGVKWDSDSEKNAYFKGGFLQGYKRTFGELLDTTWDDCPVNFDVLEQITIVRNREQHPDHISALSVRYDSKSRAKFPSLFFARDEEAELDPAALSSWFQPTVHVPRDKLLEAIEQVEALGDWLENRLIALRYRKPTQTSR